MFRWTLPWVWGTGYGGSGPVIVVDGPYWIKSHHCIGPRAYMPVVRPPVIEPGSTWSDDPTLMTFSWSEGD